jgi:hypothetical protein
MIEVLIETEEYEILFLFTSFDILWKIENVENEISIIVQLQIMRHFLYNFYHI